MRLKRHDLRKNKNMTKNTFIVRSTKIRVDENGMVSLNDIHKSAGFSVNQRPSDWLALPNPKRDIISTLKLITGKSGNWAKNDYKSVYYTKSGQAGGTWAHENLALAYASYLSSDLGVQIRDVFLRYKSGDETLIPEIRENKGKRIDELREKHRTIGKAVRKDYTQTLKDHGVDKPFDYAHCTNEVYKPILGGTATQVREQRKLPKKANLRDHITTNELAFTMAAEALATERIEQTDADGYRECRDETKQASQAIGRAIESDRKNRQEKLI
jgi:hypothetical protein